MTFNSDMLGAVPRNTELNVPNGMTDVGFGVGDAGWKPEDILLGESEHLRQYGGGDGALYGGCWESLVSRAIFAEVENSSVGQTITSQAVLSSRSYGISISSTVQTYIFSGPSPTPVNTPVAGSGKIVAYPQPARDTICFGYNSPKGGKVSIYIYNAAFQIVGHVTDNAAGNSFQQSCVPVAKLATGVYLYRANVGGFDFPLSEFGVAR